MEADIDTWMNAAQGYRRCILAARTMLSDLIRSDFNSTVLVDNASAAINVILRNMQPPLGPDDVILDLSTVWYSSCLCNHNDAASLQVYGPFAGFYTWLTSRLGVSVVTVPVQASGTLLT
jgi:hypothetical protein